MSAWSPDLPYNDLPALPPLQALESAPILKQVVEARSALARMDQAAQLLPNPAVLLQVIPLLEAQASSEIENIVTTSDELFRLADDRTSPSDQAAKEAFRYREALFEAAVGIRDRPITAQTAQQICTRIKATEMRVRDLPGTRIANPSTGDVPYSPPEGSDRIRALLGDWEQFVHAEDGLDPLVRMAVAHYQFEAIHPFADGNGRTGRILNIVVLIEAGLIFEPILYLSRIIIRTKSEYYRLLRAVTSEGDWSSWISYMVRVVEQTAKSTTVKIAAIRTAQDDFQRRAREVTFGARNVDLVPMLFELPYTRIRTVMERCGVSRPTATGWLTDLVEAGLLETSKKGRDRLFINRTLLNILVNPD